MDETQASSGALLGSGGERRMQFSLRWLLVITAAFAVLFAAAFQAHGWPQFVVLMAALWLFPLALAGSSIWIAQKVGFARLQWQRPNEAASRRQQFLWRLAAPSRFLGLCQPDNTPPMKTALLIAVVSTAAVVGLWAAIKCIGLKFSLLSFDPKMWASMGSILEDLADMSRWERLWQWEAWAVARWWLLFGVITFLWLIFASALASERQSDRWSATLKRLLMFAPWITALEVAFLIGVWIEDPNVVPEPSTGFVVGVFSWNLWHWDCWLDHGWLIRGALPTFVAGFVFFHSVLRWPWWGTLVGALLLVPAALMLSVAWTVLYLRLF